jgi:hypothetical protein
MASVVTSTPGTFAKLVEEGQVGRVTLAIEDAISKSFETHPMRQGVTGITSSEVKRRFDLCASVFVALRGDMKWSVARACDHLALYLKDELDGVDWKPNVRKCWMPGD